MKSTLGDSQPLTAISRPMNQTLHRLYIPVV